MFILKAVLRMAITGLIFLVIVLVYWRIVSMIMKIVERLKND